MENKVRKHRFDIEYKNGELIIINRFDVFEILHSVFTKLLNRVDEKRSNRYAIVEPVQQELSSAETKAEPKTNTPE